MPQTWLDISRGRAKQRCNIKAYADFLSGPYKHAENGKRAEARGQRGCLTGDWSPDQLSGKSISVVGENGIGDEVLTIGCLSDLVSTCRSVSWRCDPKLKVLFTRSFPGAAFVSDGDLQLATDGTIYSLELIGRFRKELGNLPWVGDGASSTSYLKPLASLRDSLSARYRDGSKKIVGLAWRSERRGELLSDKTCDICDVPHWTEFFECLKDKLRFVSLQYGDTADEIAFVRRKYGVEIYQDQSVDIFNDIDAAAAQIAAMDYVVSISTTAAQLAGALGVPGWVLLQTRPFAHWRAGTNLCPWYPMLRPIRQTNAGEWKTVLDIVTAEFDDEVTSTGNSG